MSCLARPLFRDVSSKYIIAKALAGTLSSSKKPKNPKFEKIRKLQEHFQKDDGKPIFLKGGIKDMILYRTTMGLALIGLILQIKLFLHYILM